MYSHHKACPISGSTLLKPLKGYESNYLVRSSPIGFVFCSRIPDESELVSHYSQYPKTPNLSPVTIKRYAEILDDFEPYRKTNRLLDVGCGTGSFLLEAQKRGWQVYGSEFNTDYVSICRDQGIEMRSGSIDPTWFPEGYFDVIVSFEVIEHIYDAIDQLKSIFVILRPGGLFHFTTPNFNALERYVLGPKYNVIQYPEHLSYYTKKTANYLMRQCGFQRKKLITIGLSINRLKSGFKREDDIVNMGGNADEIVRAKLEKNVLLHLFKFILNSIFNFFSVGNALKGWYIKPS